MSGFFNALFGKKTNSNPRKVVGVDLGATSIKVVELESHKDTISLATYGEILIGQYGNAALGDIAVLNPRQEQTALIDVFRESAVQANKAVFAIPMSSSFVTVINIPKLGASQDIAAQIPVEARKYIPVPISEVTLDWIEIQRADTEESEDSHQVLLVALQNEILKRLETLMKRTNLPGQLTEIECFSVIRGTSNQTQNSRVAIIDIGGASTKLYITNNGLVEQLHRVRSGGAHITKKIAEELKIDFTDAEALKRSYSENDDEANVIIKKVHETIIGHTLVELKQVLENYESSRNAKLSQIVLTGGVTAYSDIISIVANDLGRDVIIAQPFSSVTFPAFMEDVVQDIGPTFTIALGAALRQFE